MKISKLVFPVILLCINVVANAQENEIRITPEIKNVTVFLNGAEIKHSESISLKKGDEQNRI